MGTFRIAVTATEDFPVALPVVRRVLAGLGDIVEVAMPYRELEPREIAHFQEAFRDVDAVLLRPGIFSRPILEPARRLKIIAVHGAGVDQVDVPSATELGIVVVNAPGANANAVAELTLGLIVSLLRRIPETDRRVRLDGQWGEARGLGRELRGQVVGLLGVGAVGGRVGALAQAFGAAVIAYDPYVDSAKVSPGVRLVDLPTLLQTSDIVSLHLPLNAQTQGLLHAGALRQMKRGALVVNTSRGGIVDDEALLRAVGDGHLGGAALDVLTDESAPSRLVYAGRQNIIVTPHIGGSTVECLDRVAEVASEEIARFLRGEPVRHAVNPHVRPRPVTPGG